MKLKNKISFGIISGVIVATTTLSLCPTSLTRNNVVTTSKNSDSKQILNNESNATYVTISFTSDDPEVTFDGSTSIKVKAGKTFATIVPPKATKPECEFKNWYYLNGSEQVILEPTTIISNDLEIHPLFTEFVPTTFFAIRFNDNDSILTGPSISIAAKGSTFGVVPKPTATREGWAFIGWYDSASGGSEVSSSTIINDNMTVYAHFINGGVYTETFDITANSSYLTIELKAVGEVPYRQIAYLANHEQTAHSWPSVGYLTVPQGQTISILCGPASGVQAVPFSVDENNYRHFIIHGTATLSGTLEGLLDNGYSSEYIADADTIPGDYCYYNLFKDATPTADDKILISQGVLYQNKTFLPALNLTPHCYENMFSGCNGIDNIPIGLFANVSQTAESCFAGMFSKCKDLINIPGDLLSFGSTSPSYCANMFNGCSQLKKAPNGFLTYSNEIMAHAYEGLFANTGLTKIPEEIFNYSSYLHDYCFAHMFEGCENITSLSENFFSKFDNFAKYNAGIFAYMLAGTGIRSIPENLFQTNIILDYLFQGLFKDCKNITSIPSGLFPWESLQPTGTTSTGFLANMFEGCTGITSIPSDLFHTITILSPECFKEMFKGCTGITSISSDLLPWEDLYNPYITAQIMYPESCFEGMFSGCANLEAIPSGLLPSSHVPLNGYQDMFNGCSKITLIPENFLPAATIDNFAYAGIFEGCTKLASIPENLLGNVTATSLPKGCCARMFKKCTSLTQLPSVLLNGKVVNASTCEEMFAECTSLKAIPNGFFGNSTPYKSGCTNAYKKAFYKCTSLETLPDVLFTKNIVSMTSANCLESMFEGCSSIKTIPANFFSVTYNIPNGCEKFFYRMFADCTSLTSVLAKLPLAAASVFVNKQQQINIWAEMFSGCINLTTISPDFFGFINTFSTAGKTFLDSLFYNMFKGCEKLTITQDDATAGTLFLDLNNGLCTIASGVDSLTGMFAGCNCVGFNGTPEIGHKYYLQVN